MMWEESRAEESKWFQYLGVSLFETLAGSRGSTNPSPASLPSQFDTPMFWSGEELDELRGTSVVGTPLPLFCFARSPVKPSLQVR